MAKLARWTGIAIRALPLSLELPRRTAHAQRCGTVQSFELAHRAILLRNPRAWGGPWRWIPFALNARRSTLFVLKFALWTVSALQRSIVAGELARITAATRCALALWLKLARRATATEIFAWLVLKTLLMVNVLMYYTKNGH